MTGDKLILSLAFELDRERKKLAELIQVCDHLLPILQAQPQPEIGDWNWRGLSEELAKAIQKAKENP